MKEGREWTDLRVVKFQKKSGVIAPDPHIGRAHPP